MSVKEPAEPAPLITRLTMAEQAFQFLRQAILSNQILPGEELKESDIAEQLSISRTPVREAIRMLEAEGLVARQPYRHGVVARRSLEDMVNAFHIRIALEAYAARLAAAAISAEQIDVLEQICQHLDTSTASGDLEGLSRGGQAFHSQLVQVCGNPRIADHIQQVNEYIHSYRVRLYDASTYKAANLVDHRHILEALRSRDGDLADRLMRDHLVCALNIIRALWQPA